MNARTPVVRHPTTNHALTGLQVAVIVALLREHTFLRWHSYITAPAKIRGRGTLENTPVYADKPLPAYTVRALVRSGLIEPKDAENRIGFAEGGNTYRDYVLTARGRALALTAKQKEKGAEAPCA